MHPSLLQIDDSEPSPLVGIAKLAAQGESLKQGHLVEYFTLPTKAVLNRCTSARVPFDWTINPYRGCEFACKYCYARYTHEFMEMRDGVDFERKIYVKQQTAWLLRQDLKKVKRGEQIAIGTATDPYQPAEKRFEVTRGILEELALHHGLDIGIVTKSDLVTRDIDLLLRVAEHNSLYVNLTITTLNTKLARVLEPRAPRPDLRLHAVRELNAAGVKVGVICAPVLPGITDSPVALDKLVLATKQAGGRYIYANRAVSEAVFGQHLSAVSGEGIPRSGRELSQALRQSRLRQQGLQQAAVRTDVGAAQEARHHPRDIRSHIAGTSAENGGRTVGAVRVGFFVRHDFDALTRCGRSRTTQQSHFCRQPHSSNPSSAPSGDHRIAGVRHPIGQGLWST